MVKSSPSLRTPLQPLPVPAECWESASMDFVFRFPTDLHMNTGILVFVDIFRKMVHLFVVPETINASAFSRVFIDTVFRIHGLPRKLVFDRDPRFTAESGVPCSKLLERALKCSHLTILKPMIIRKAQIVSLKRYFAGKSILLQIGDNS